MKKTAGMIAIALLMTIFVADIAQARTRTGVCDATLEITTCSPPARDGDPPIVRERRTPDYWDMSRDLFVRMLLRIFGS